MSLNDFAAKLSHTPVPWWLARAASVALAGYAIVTGIDYLHTPARTGRSLTMVERIATLHTWGVWYVIAGATLGFGLLLGRHVIVWFGHLLCAALYGAFAAATTQAVLDFQQSPAAATGWIWRAAYVSFMIFVGHVFLCWLRGPIPRRGDEAE